MLEHNTTAATLPIWRRAVRAVLGLFSSVWFGIVIMTLIFVYASLGSAYPPLRQHWWLEMTEFEFFHWWPFDLLIGLLVANLVVTTVRRIRFNRINAGVWMIHTGIVTLALGSVYYFGTKLEGDTPIFRRQAVIRVPGQVEPVRMLIRPGNHAMAGAGDNAYHFEVVNIQPEYGLRSAGHEGEQAYSVQISVQTPTQQFIRQVLAGYPEFTEDVIPGKGRAVKETGKALLDETLDIQLEYAPQDEFFLMDSAALYVRPRGSSEWKQRPIEDLPHYHERIASRGEVWMPPGENIPIRPIDLTVPPGPDGDDPLAGYNVHVTGFLRYAFESERWLPGGDRLNPVCRLRLEADVGQPRDYELVAFDPQAGQAEDGHLVFRWVESEEEAKAAAAATSESVLSIRVPDKSVTLAVPIAAPEADEKERPHQPIEGTEYAYRVQNVFNHLAIPSGRLKDRTVSVAVVDIRKGEREFTRWVADIPEATRDITADTHEATEMDTGITLTYQPGNPAVLTVLAGPDPLGVRFLHRLDDGTLADRVVKLGERVALAEGIRATVQELIPQARREVRPAIVPEHERDRDARQSFSMIQVEVSRSDWSTDLWLPFNHYALPDGQYGVPGRIAYQPKTIRLPDGRRVELLFSRQRRPLPNPVVLERFTLDTFQGGLSGSNGNVRDYISQLRFSDGSGGWSQPVEMRSNRPATNGGFWFFQSTWDPPSQSSAGMNYTGAGVGNRNGVYVQLAGCCLAVTGMIYAFYFKPVLIRRRQKAARAFARAEGRPEREQSAAARAERESVVQV